MLIILNIFHFLMFIWCIQSAVVVGCSVAQFKNLQFPEYVFVKTPQT